MKKLVKALLVMFCVVVLLLGTVLVYNLDQLPAIAERLDYYAQRLTEPIGSLEDTQPTFPLPDEISYTDLTVHAADILLPFSELDAGAGMLLELEAALSPSDAADDIVFTSSDPDIVECSDGQIIALHEGEAVITVSAGQVSRTVTVTVTNDCLERTAVTLEQLTTGVGGENVYLTALSLLHDLHRSSHNEAAVLYSLLYEITAYAQGFGNAQNLAFAAQSAQDLGFDIQTSRTAAAACWAYGQTMNHDVVFSFVGDCTLARYNEQNRSNQYPALFAASGSITYPFDNVRSIFSADTLTVVNCEGVLTDRTSHESKSFYFRGDPEYAKTYALSGVELANLANNHSLDYKQAGFNDTVSALAAQGIGSFWADTPYVSEIETAGGTVRVVMLSTSSLNIKNSSKFAALKKLVTQHKSDGTIVVVNLHWGTELAVKPSSWQVSTAHELIDAGADLIVGHHPHILQGIEEYNGAFIAYSLGNFAFGGNSKCIYPQTVILRACVDLNDKGNASVSSIGLIPCHTTSTGTQVNDYKPCLLWGDEADSVIRLIMTRSAMLEGGITEADIYDID